MGESETISGTDPVITVLLGLFFILTAAKFAGIIFEKFKQPAVLGEIIAGIILGNLSLFGFNFFESFEHVEVLKVLAELGVILLLFEIGLETKLQDMLAVGVNSLLVACVGVACPFALGYWVSTLVMPEITLIQQIFVGAILTATSVGITARVFKDLNFTNAIEARIVLGAAVIDDVLGLIILAIVSGMAHTGNLDFASASLISIKSIGFLLAFSFVGVYLFQFIVRNLAKHRIPGLMLITALALCFMGAFMANQVGLAAIVGAFATGLVLVEDHFKHSPEEANTVMKDIRTINTFLVPIFFVMTGMQVNLGVFNDSAIVIAASVITLVAILGKIISGWGFFSKENVRRLVIGVGMIPRGEVGLIFATVGKTLGIVDDRIFAITVMVVMVTTLVPPFLLNGLIKKNA